MKDSDKSGDWAEHGDGHTPLFQAPGRQRQAEPCGLGDSLDYTEILSQKQKQTRVETGGLASASRLTSFQGWEAVKSSHQLWQTVEQTALVLSAREKQSGSHSWKPWRVGHGSRSQPGAAMAKPASPPVSLVLLDWSEVTSSFLQGQAETTTTTTG